MMKAHHFLEYLKKHEFITSATYLVRKTRLKQGKYKPSAFESKIIMELLNDDISLSLAIENLVKIREDFKNAKPVEKKK